MSSKTKKQGSLLLGLASDKTDILTPIFKIPVPSNRQPKLSLLAQAVAYCFSTPLLFSPSVFAAACPGSGTGGGILVNTTDVSCIIADGQYQAFQVLDVRAQGSSITNTGNLSLVIPSSTTGRGVMTTYGGSVFLNNVTVNGGVSGGRMYGLHAASPLGTGLISVDGLYKFNGTGTGVIGVLSGGDNNNEVGDVRLNTVDIEIGAGNAGIGMLSRRDKSSIVVSGDLYIYTASTGGGGIQVQNNSTVELQGVNNRIVAAGATGGLLVQTGATFKTAQQLTIMASGTNAYGIRTTGAKATVQLGNVDITANDAGATVQSGASLQVSGNADIYTGGYALDVSGNASGVASNVSLSGSRNRITATGNNAALSVKAGGLITINSADTIISYQGDSGAAVQLSGSNSQINLNGGQINTTGAGAHGFQALAGGKKVFDGSNGNMLPTITVLGSDAALLNANGSGSRLSLTGNTSLDMAMTAGSNTWGAKADNAGTIEFAGNASTGGTALWTNSGTLRLSDQASAAGSHVRLENSSILMLDSLSNNTVTIGSLQGDSNSEVRFSDSNDTLIMGANNAANNGSLMDNAVYAGQFGSGKLEKVGTLTQTLTGAGNTVSQVDVKGGILNFNQDGAFTVTGDYTTNSGGTTRLGDTATVLQVDGTFTQEAGSVLDITLNNDTAGNPIPDIQAGSAVLGGTIMVRGFSSAGTPNKASEILANQYTVIRSDNDIIGDFENNPLTPSGMDFLLYNGSVSADRKEYQLGFKLAWTQGGQAKGTGTFTLGDSNTAFDMDIDRILADQVLAAGDEYASGWDGKSLTKKGEGTLIFSEKNTYTGKTTIEAGTLKAAKDDSFASSSDVIVNGGVLMLGDYDPSNPLNPRITTQTAQRLQGSSGGTIALEGGTLIADNSTGDSQFYGVIKDGDHVGGSLEKTGSGVLTLAGDNDIAGNASGSVKVSGGSLTLTGNNTFTAGTTISTGGTLNVGNGGDSGSLTGNINNNSNLNFNRIDDSQYDGVLSGSGKLTKQGAGQLTLSQVGSQGAVEVQQGTLDFNQQGTFTLGSLVTQAGATTSMGAEETLLNITGAFEQQAGSTLSITLNNNALSVADIEAGSVTLGGEILVSGFSGGVSNKASLLTQHDYTVIRSQTAISGNFTNSGESADGLDFILHTGTIEGGVNGANTEYRLGFKLAWERGGNDWGTGDFTLATGTAFELDTALANNIGSYQSLWDGKSLSKYGAGELTLSAVNTYDGNTTVNEGTLVLASTGSIASSSDVVVKNDATLKVSGGQTLNKLAGDADSKVELDAASVATLNNALTTDNSHYAGSITGSGSLVKTGAGDLSLSGNNSYSGGTTINGGSLSLSGNTSSWLSGSNNAIVNNATLNLNYAGNVNYTGQLSGTGLLNKQGLGEVTLDLSQNLTQGAIDVQAGTLTLSQNGSLTVDHYTTQTGATTVMDEHNTFLNVTGTFEQKAGSSLNVTLSDGSQADITADRVVLNGALSVSGFVGANLPNKVSDIGNAAYQHTLIDSQGRPIEGDFSNASLIGESSADYLLYYGFKNNDKYQLGYKLTWTDGGASAGHGQFSIGLVDDVDDPAAVSAAQAQSFEVDSILSNQSGTFASGWNGKDLVKNGLGMLILSQANEYSGTTTINEGTLKSTAMNSIAASSGLWLYGTGVWDMTGKDQTLQQLSGGADSQILLNGAKLSVGNASNSRFDGLLSADASSQLEKTGNGRLTLGYSGDFSLGEVTVNAGTLAFEHTGTFRTSGNYTTQSGATTALGHTLTLFDIGGTFTQAANSTLSITLNGDKTQADITAQAVDLDNTSQIIINGFNASSAPAQATDVTSGYYKVIVASGGNIDGNFANSPISSHGTDYLLHTGSVVGNEYRVGFHLAWDSSQTEHGTGTFTVNDSTAFDINRALVENTTGGFASNWDGKSLTKAGAGLLVLSGEQQHYSGSTTLNAGVLRTDVADVLKNTGNVIVNGGLLLLNNHVQQTINNLSGNGGQVDLNGTSLIANHGSVSDNTVFAGDIVDSSNGSGTFHKEGEGSLTLSGNTHWTGDTYIHGGKLILDGSQGKAKLSLSNGKLYGHASNPNALELKNGAVLNAVIDPTDVIVGTASTWNMTGSSQVNNLTLAGTLNIQSTAGSPQQLTVEGNYDGQNGLLVFQGELSNDDSLVDELLVQGDTSGSTRVQVNNLGGLGDQTINGIQLISVAGTSAGEFVKAGRIVAGAYDYDVVRSANGKDWVLQSRVDGGNGGQGIVRPEAGSYASNLHSARQLFDLRWEHHSQAQTYLDPFSGQEKLSHVWLRAETARQRNQDASGQLAQRNDRHIVQVGAPLIAHDVGSAQTQLGVLGGYGSHRNRSQSDINGYQATGKTVAYHLGAYASWQADKQAGLGAYVDSWLHYAWFKQEVSGDNLATESYRAHGISASLETGYTFKLAEHPPSGSAYYLQPQAQITWQGITMNDLREQNGSLISSNRGNLQTRLGVKGYLQHHSHAQGQFSPSLELNWLHNRQVNGVTLDGVEVAQNAARHVGELRLGLGYQLGKQLQFNSKLGYQFGQSAYRDTSLMLELKGQF